MTATWTKDSVPLVQDVRPHIRMRSSCLPKVLGNSHEENCQECFLWLVSENQLVSKFTESISVHCSGTRNIDAANHHTITLQKRFAESAFHDACRTFSQALGAVHTVFPRSDAAATINFPLLALAATIRGRRLLEGGVYSRAASIILYTIVYCLAASILIMSCSKVLFLVVIIVS